MRRAGRRSRGGSGVGGTVVAAAVILVGSAALGLVVNHFSPRGIPIFPKGQTERPALPEGLLGMSAAEAYGAFSGGGAVFIDARSAEEYAEGHVPGAVNIRPGEFEDAYLEWAEVVDAARSVVIYCEGIECGDAVEVGERLLEVFERSVYVFEEGWRAWEAARYPVSRGETRWDRDHARGWVTP